MRFSTPKKEVKKVKEQKSSPKKEQPKENQAER